MKRSHHSKGGAGILFWRHGESGAVEVLLGKRSKNMSHAPGKWSYFGGGLHSGEDFLACAYREAAEETANNDESVIKAREHFSELKPLMWLILWPFYKYQTFSCEVIKEPKAWPRLDSTTAKSGWFVMDNLPEPLHSEARRAVGRLRRR